MNRKVFLIGMLGMFLGLTGLLSGCQSKYEQVRQRELARGIRHDSLFFGYYLGMPQEAFFARCTQLNRRKLITNGMGNKVTYNLPDLSSAAKMYFYPVFQDGKIIEMPVLVNYIQWAPWEKQYHADKMVPELVQLLEKWHGPGFFKLSDPKKGTVYVKIDGNRQIVVGAQDEQFAKIVFSDLLVKKRQERSTGLNPWKVGIQ